MRFKVLWLVSEVSENSRTFRGLQDSSIKVHGNFRPQKTSVNFRRFAEQFQDISVSAVNFYRSFRGL